MNRRKPWKPSAVASLLALLAAGSALGFALGVGAAPAPPSDDGAVIYEVTAVEGKLVRRTGRGEERLGRGDRLAGGDELLTGWFSAADLAAAREAARFHLRARTRVRLAVDRPGVLLVLEKGRLRALFDRLTGGEERERRIETPSAVLAVRGTEYGVAVGRDGATTLVVFEGTVEVWGPAAPTGPVQVGPGQALRVRRGEAPGAPYRHGLSPRGWDRGEMPAMTPGIGRLGPTGRGPGRREQGPPPRPQGPPPSPPPAGD